MASASKFLLMSLRQFVISRPIPNFEAVRESIHIYLDIIEVDAVTHSFKNVAFGDGICNLCYKDHQSLGCPSLKSVIEMEMPSKDTYSPRHRIFSPENQGKKMQGYKCFHSEYIRWNGNNRNRRFGGN